MVIDSQSNTLKVIQSVRTPLWEVKDIFILDIYVIVLSPYSNKIGLLCAFMNAENICMHASLTGLCLVVASRGCQNINPSAEWNISIFQTANGTLVKAGKASRITTLVADFDSCTSYSRGQL